MISIPALHRRVYRDPCQKLLTPGYFSKKRFKKIQQSETQRTFETMADLLQAEPVCSSEAVTSRETVQDYRTVQVNMNQTAYSVFCCLDKWMSHCSAYQSCSFLTLFKGGVGVKPTLKNSTFVKSCIVYGGIWWSTTVGYI